MARTCTICSHPERRDIDRLLVTREASYRDITGRFGVSRSALTRHRQTCLPELLARAQEARQLDADELVKTARALLSKAVRILQTAEAEQNWSIALAGIRESRNCLALLVEIEGQIDRRPAVNLVLHPEWVQVRTVMIRALDPYPEAKVAVADALGEVEANGRAG